MDNEDKRILLMKFFPIIIGVFLLILIVYLIFSTANKKYIILGNYLIYEKTSFEYKQLDEFTDKMAKLKYIVSDGKNVKKDVKLQFLNNKFYLYNKKGAFISKYNFRAASNGLNVQLADYKVINIHNVSEDKYIKDFLDSYNIRDYDTYNAFCYSYDFNKDGNDEFIYTLNNYSLASADYDQYGFMFIVQNDKIVYKTDVVASNSYKVMEIIDMDNDGKYELIVSKGSRDLATFSSCYQIYNLKGNKWKIIKNCR